MMRILFPSALLGLILLALPAMAQRTLTVVSSDPADSSLQVEAFNYSYGGHSWIAINPIALFNGTTGAPSQLEGIAPYAQVGYFRAISPDATLGGGLHLSLEGKHPGIFLTTRGYSDAAHHLWFGSWTFSYRTFGDAGELWNLSYGYGIQSEIASKVVISVMAGVGYSKASAPNPYAYPDAPILKSGFGFSFGADIGYVL